MSERVEAGGWSVGTEVVEARKAMVAFSLIRGRWKLVAATGRPFARGPAERRGVDLWRAY